MRSLSAVLALILLVGLLPGRVAATTGRVPGVEPLPGDVEVRVHASEMPDGMSGVEAAKSVSPGRHLGSVTVGGAEYTSWNKVLRKARGEARKLGGDAILVQNRGYGVSTGYAMSGGMALPVHSQTKAFVGKVLRTHAAEASGAAPGATPYGGYDPYGR